MATSDGERVLARPRAAREVLRRRSAHGRHRRFFDVGELGGVRVEHPEVFETTHRLVLRLVREGLVDGLRIDHPDGLADPRGYLEQLRVEGASRVWVEKIIEPGEAVREWPVQGTTGYEFLNDVQALFVDPLGEPILTQLAGEERPWHEVAFEAKLEQATTTFQPEVERLLRLLDVPDLAHELSSLPVYRTYVEPWSGRVDAADRAAIGALSGELPPRAAARGAGPRRVRDAVPADSGPVMAKGRRGHGVLPLRPAAGPERGRRRSRALRALGRRSSILRTPRAPRTSRARSSPARRTTRSAAPTCARESARWPGWPSAGASTSCAGTS